VCHFCALPIPGASGPEPRYCCYGCRFAAEVAGASGERGAANWALVRLCLAVFCALNVMAFTMALWSEDVYGPPGAEETLAGRFHGVFRYLCLLFTLPVLLLLGGPLLEDALAALRRGRLATDLLLLVGVAAAFSFSAWSVGRDGGPIYFEIACMVLVLVTLGRWLEATGKIRATQALEGLQELLPRTARRVHAGREEVVPLEAVGVGECVRVLAGERIPCDGRVDRNPISVDEQFLTGESRPVEREVGERVWAGALNLDGDAYVAVTAPAHQGALARLAELLREVRLRRSRHERFADRVSAWFLPLVVALAVGTTLYHGRAASWDRGVLAGLSVLLIACPCALGLATPMALWAGLGQAARHQVIFQNAEALERLAEVRVVALDKTGTLTTGRAPVETLALGCDEERHEVLARAAALAGASHHSLSRAIVQYAGAQTEVVDAVQTKPGRGVATSETALGSERFMHERACRMPAELADAVARARRRAAPLVCVAWKGQVRGVFVHREELRPEAKSAVAALRALGLRVEVLTGDHAERGAQLGRELGLPVHADLLPEDKLAELERMRRAYGPVAMVGDGINDSPALAASDVGIALGSAVDVARGAAAACLVSDDLTRLPWAIGLARRTLRTIRLNLFWSFVFNVAGLAWACTGRLNPVVAALAMTASSLLVVASSLRLARTAPTGVAT
jgi:heavy metal translocating P-type ATPase